MIPVSERPRVIAARVHGYELPLVRVIAVEPIGVVVGGRTEPVDDDWGAVEAVIRLDGRRFGPDAVAGLTDFSHLVVVFVFHLVDEARIETGARRPRGNPDWPEVGMFAQRAKMRPNRLGVTASRWSESTASSFTYEGSTRSTVRPCSTSSPMCASSNPCRATCASRAGCPS